MFLKILLYAMHQVEDIISFQQPSESTIISVSIFCWEETEPQRGD